MEPTMNYTEPPVTALSDAMCGRCKKMVPFGVFFCPHCGTVSLQNMLIKGGTTAHDESQNEKNRRPWKELPQPKLPPKDKSVVGVKKNSTLLSKSSAVLWSSEDKPAWVPTMKQPTKKQKKINAQRLVQTEIGTSNVEGYSSNIIYIDGTPYMKVDSNNPQHGKDIPKHIDDSVGTLNGHDSGMGPGSVDVAETPGGAAAVAVKALNPIAPKLIWTDTVHPLAVFDATWLNNSIQETSIHISLLERKLNTSSTNRSQFWLRIGSVSVPSVLTAGEEESELEVLGLISNDVGRLLTPSDRDWVDLETISPNEHYVVTYLQNILIFIAQRALFSDLETTVPSLHTGKDRKNSKDRNHGKGQKMVNMVDIDQYCVVGTSHNTRSSRFVRVEMREERSDKLRCKKQIPSGDDELGTIRKKNVDGDRDSNRDSSEGEGDTNNNSSNHQSTTENESNIANTGTIADSVKIETVNTDLIPLFFSDYLSQLTCRIPLGPHLSSKKVTAIARLSIVYGDQDPLVALPPTFEQSQIPLPHPFNNRANDKNQMEINQSNKSQKSEKSEKMVTFEKDGDITPPRGNSEDKADDENRSPKGGRNGVKNNYQAKVTHVKVSVTPMYSKVPIGMKVILFETSSLPYLLGPTDPDVILSQTHKEVSQLLQSLCSVLRYSHTTHGVKLVVVGATLFPEHMYVSADPPGSDCDDEGDDGEGEVEDAGEDGDNVNGEELDVSTIVRDGNEMGFEKVEKEAGDETKVEKEVEDVENGADKEVEKEVEKEVFEPSEGVQGGGEEDGGKERISDCIAVQDVIDVIESNLEVESADHSLLEKKKGEEKGEEGEGGEQRKKDHEKDVENDGEEAVEREGEKDPDIGREKVDEGHEREDADRSHAMVSTSTEVETTLNGDLPKDAAENSVESIVDAQKIQNTEETEAALQGSNSEPDELDDHTAELEGNAIESPPASTTVEGIKEGMFSSYLSYAKEVPTENAEEIRKESGIDEGEKEVNVMSTLILAESTNETYNRGTLESLDQPVEVVLEVETASTVLGVDGAGDAKISPVVVGVENERQ